MFAPTSTNFYTGTAFPGIVDSLYQIKEDDTAAWERVKVGAIRQMLVPVICTRSYACRVVVYGINFI